MIKHNQDEPARPRTQKNESSNEESCLTNVEYALREYFRIKQKYENQLGEDQLPDELPQEDLERFLAWCEQLGGAPLAEAVAERLGTSQRVFNALRRVACHDSRKPFRETRPKRPRR